MKKILIASTVASFVVLSGCQQIQDSAQNLKNESSKIVDTASQQAENIKTSALDIKKKYDEKSQQVVNTVDAVNQLTK